MSKCAVCYTREGINQCRYCKDFMCKEHGNFCTKCDVYYCKSYYHECSKDHKKQCFAISQTKELKDKVDSLDNEIKEIKDTLAEMKQMLTDLLYAPNGPMYQEAKQDFESRT